MSMPLCVWMGGLSPLCGPSPPSSLHCEEAPAHHVDPGEAPAASALTHLLYATDGGGGSSQSQVPSFSSRVLSPGLHSQSLSASQRGVDSAQRRSMKKGSWRLGNRCSVYNVGSEGPKKGEAIALGRCTLGGTRDKVGRRKLSGVTRQICQGRKRILGSVRAESCGRLELQVGRQ